MMLSRSDRSSFSIWLWTIDKWIFFSFFTLLLLGIIFILTSSSTLELKLNKDDELSKQEYSGKRTNPSKEILPINKNERIGEDLKIGIKASIENEEDFKFKIKQKEVWKNLIDEVDDILDDI